jgi:hypothetical protein
MCVWGRFADALASCTETMLRNVVYDCAEDDEDGVLLVPTRLVLRSAELAPPELEGEEEEVGHGGGGSGAGSGAAAAGTSAFASAAASATVAAAGGAVDGAKLLGAHMAAEGPVVLELTEGTVYDAADEDDGSDAAREAGVDADADVILASPLGASGSGFPMGHARRESAAVGTTGRVHGSVDAASRTVSVTVRQKQLFGDGALYRLSDRLMGPRLQTDTAAHLRQRRVQAIEVILQARARARGWVGRVLRPEELGHGTIGDLVKSSTNITLRWRQV